jgi:hypothetical protein
MIGVALEQVMAEIAASGSWCDRRKAEWLIAKLQARIDEDDELAGLRGPLTPFEVVSETALGLRYYLYDRHK